MSFLQATANEILGEVKELKQWLEYGFKDMHAVGADYEVAMTRFKDAQATKASSDFNQYVSYFFEPQIAKWEEYRFQYYRQGSTVESLLTFGLRTSSDNKKTIQLRHRRLLRRRVLCGADSQVCDSFSHPTLHLAQPSC